MPICCHRLYSYARRLEITMSDKGFGPVLTRKHYQEIYGTLSLPQINAICIAYGEGGDKTKKELSKAFSWLLRGLEDD